MKKAVFVLIFLMNSFAVSEYTFEFVSYKDGRSGQSIGVLTHQFMRRMRDTFSIDFFVETGTIDGINSANAASVFKNVYTIEIFEPMYLEAKKRLDGYPNVSSYLGNSSKVLAQILPALKKEGNILFWLDAHYSGPGTGMSEEDLTDINAYTPIRNELKAIHASGVRDCVILIDDIRGFGTRIDNKSYMGAWWGYPTVQEIRDLLFMINEDFDIVLMADILLAYDKTKFNITFSPVVHACTKTRFYDGTNLTDDELLASESTIANSGGSERAFIKWVSNIASEKNRALFIYDLWDALIEHNAGNYAYAYNCFNAVLNRKEFVDENYQTVDRYISYDHWRIYWYLAQAAEKSGKGSEAKSYSQEADRRRNAVEPYV